MKAKLNIVVFKKLPAAGMALFPFILVKEQKYKFNIPLIRHECIHFKQQLELLIIPFYLLYLLFYILKYLKYRNKEKAYLAIPFEKEAYENERKIGYLKNRKPFIWLQYL